MVDAHIQRMLDTAVQERRAGRTAAAVEMFRAVLEQGGEHPKALNALGLHAIDTGAHDEAIGLLKRAITADATAPELWMNLARAHRERGDDAAEAAALDGALAIDQRHFMALVRMAELHERQGDAVRAAERWSGVLAIAAAIDAPNDGLVAMLDHARGYVRRQRESFADTIDRGLAGERDAMAAVDRRRVDACIDHALGRRSIYANSCAGMHFPFLPADEFFPRQHFPWLAGIEAQTEVIRDELLSILAEDAALVRPYVAMAPGTPPNKWSALDQSLQWGALHLWKDGQRDDAVCARAPRTAAAIEALPLSDLPQRTPTVFFSILQPGAHLPAHTGVSNVRAIVHLPLIVPAGCSFRVGGETRDWRAGEAWVFDDTIEHEAWNRSDAMRAILIFDVWNPYITLEERTVLRRFYAVAAQSDHALQSVIQVSD